MGAPAARTAALVAVGAWLDESGSAVHCLPSRLAPRHGDPERDRACAAARVRARAEVFPKLIEPPEVWEEEPIEPSALPGHGARYAKLAAERGFTVVAIEAHGSRGHVAHVLRAQLGGLMIAARWIDRSAAGAGVRTARAARSFNLSTFPAELQAIAAL